MFTRNMKDVCYQQPPSHVCACARAHMRACMCAHICVAHALLKMTVTFQLQPPVAHLFVKHKNLCLIAVKCCIIHIIKSAATVALL